MTGEHSVRGRVYRAEHTDPRFRHAAGRAAVPPERPASHLRAADTGEMPTLPPQPGCDLRVPFWLSCVIWFIAAAAAIAMLGSAWAVGRVWQIERAVEKPVIITVTPSP